MSQNNKASGLRRWEKVSSGSNAGSSAKNTINKAISGFSDAEKKMHRLAYLQLLLALTGNEVIMDLTDGRKLKGILHTTTPFQGMKHEYVLKSTVVISGANGKGKGEIEPGSIVVINAEDLVSIESTKIDLMTRSFEKDQFQTDSQTKKHGDLSYLEGRDLQRAGDWLGADTAASASLNSNSTGNWDQFSVNRKKFGVKSTYDENIYTKKIGK